MSGLIRVSMKQQVYDIIKQRILSQIYDLGAPINIVSLSKELSISNTPIREALSMLCAEGLVVSNVNSKFRVVELTEQSMRELNETAFIILSGSYICCCINEKVTLLENLLQEAFAVQQKAYQEEDTVHYIQKAMEFDDCFVKATGNKKLISVFDGLSDMLFLSIRYAYQHSQMAKHQNLEEHLALLNAVKARDSVSVQRLLYTHYDKHICTQEENP